MDVVLYGGPADGFTFALKGHPSSFPPEIRVGPDSAGLALDVQPVVQSLAVYVMAGVHDDVLRYRFEGLKC
jgi:hypothetical protein